MNRQRGVLIILAISLLIPLVWKFRNSEHLSKKLKEEPITSTAEVILNGQAVKQKMARQTAAIPVNQENAAGALTQKKIVINDKSLDAAQEFTRQIGLFNNYKQKIFKTENEKKEYKNIISNRHFLLAAQNRLQDINFLKSTQFSLEQGLIVDALLAALADGDQQTAQQVIADVIKDAQVEDSSLPMQVRQRLAGVKAELLYQATSLQPDRFLGIETQLPGPVSQKIWINVQSNQQRNLEESNEELKRAPQTASK